MKNKYQLVDGKHGKTLPTTGSILSAVKLVQVTGRKGKGHAEVVTDGETKQLVGFDYSAVD